MRIKSRVRALPKWADETIASGQFAIAHKKVQPQLVAKLEVKQLETEMAAETRWRVRC